MWNCRILSALLFHIVFLCSSAEVKINIADDAAATQLAVAGKSVPVVKQQVQKVPSRAMKGLDRKAAAAKGGRSNSNYNNDGYYENRLSERYNSYGYNSEYSNRGYNNRDDNYRDSNNDYDRSGSYNDNNGNDYRSFSSGQGYRRDYGQNYDDDDYRGGSYRDNNYRENDYRDNNNNGYYDRDGSSVSQRTQPSNSDQNVNYYYYNVNRYPNSQADQENAADYRQKPVDDYRYNYKQKPVDDYSSGYKKTKKNYSKKTVNKPKDNQEEEDKGKTFGKDENDSKDEYKSKKKQDVKKSCYALSFGTKSKVALSATVGGVPDGKKAVVECPSGSSLVDEFGNDVAAIESICVDGEYKPRIDRDKLKGLSCKFPVS